QYIGGRQEKSSQPPCVIAAKIRQPVLDDDAVDLDANLWLARLVRPGAPFRDKTTVHRASDGFDIRTDRHGEAAHRQCAAALKLRRSFVDCPGSVGFGAQ